MRKMQVLLAVMTILAMLLASCQQSTTPAPTAVVTEAPPAVMTEEPTAVMTEEPTAAATEEPTAAATEAPTEVAGSDLGTEAHPIKVLFVPSVDANTIVAGGEIMAQALEEATGLKFEVSVPASYAATIEEMCASPADTMAFIPAQGYVLANQLCGVDVAFKAVRRGWGVYWAQFIVPRDSDIDSLEDLDGLKWAYPDAGSTSGFLYPSAMFLDMGIQPGDTLEAGGHPGVVRAVYNGEADFGTTYFSAPAVPEGQPLWTEDDPPDIPDDLIETCAVSGNALMCSGWTVLDARATLREEAPDVVQKVRILALTDPIPNDTLSFGPDFPADLREEIGEALLAFAQTEAWAQSIGSEDFYGWSGLEVATDEEYDPVRLIVEFAGITLESIGR